MCRLGVVFDDEDVQSPTLHASPPNRQCEDSEDVFTATATTDADGWEKKLFGAAAQPRDSFWQTAGSGESLDLVMLAELGPVRWHAKVFNQVMGDGRVVTLRSKAEDKTVKGEDPND